MGIIVKDFNVALGKTKKRTMHINRSCRKSSRTGRPKVKYVRQEDAAFDAALMSTDRNEKLVAYYCVYCDNWHIGHYRRLDG